MPGPQVESPARVGSSDAELEQMRRLLEATGDYRVLRRLRVIYEFGAPSASSTFVAAYLDIARRVETAIAHPVAAVVEQFDLRAAAIGQTARREEIGQRLAIDDRARLRGAARVGDIFGMADLAVIDRRDAAPRQRDKSERGEQVRHSHDGPPL